MKNRAYTAPLLLASFVALFLISCAGSRRIVDEGVASYYGRQFHGKKTASGERFNMYRYTAAHKTLPLGTKVKVVNLDNGKSVKVKINDRGPYADGRIIDLSKRAARKIGMLSSGTARVRLYLISSPGNVNTRSAKKSVAAGEQFTVQVGSFGSKRLAKQKSSNIRGSRVDAVRVKGKTVYRVYYGSFGSKDQAQRAMRKLKRRGIDGFVKQVDG